MDVTHQTADEQARLWNGPSGRAWVDAQAWLDAMFQPFEDLLVNDASASGGRVLDVGCGTGATTLAVARRHGAASRCVGIDISAPMIAAARASAERAGTPASFIHANAQTHVFAPASFDMIISRFGVMFFDEPVRAFANLRRAMKSGGELRAITWRSPAENPFMTTAERAAASLLPAMPPRRPDAPGQFAFADEERVRRILEESGWAGIELRRLDVECAMPENALNLYVTRLGPVGMALQDADEATRTRVTQAVRAAFAPFIRGGEARFTVACWMVCARA
jgi:ubiquinone/menaquinone biosynthesis C-methylase UbiE